MRQWLPPNPCSLMRDGWMRSVYQSILQKREISITSQSISRLAPRRHVRASTISYYSTASAPTARTTPHTPTPSSVRRVQPRICPPTHTIRVLL